VEALTELGHTVQPYNLGDRLMFYDRALMDANGWTPYSSVSACLQGDLIRGETVPASLLNLPEDDEGPQELKLRKAVPTHEDVFLMAANGLMSTAMQFWPDVILAVSCFFIPLYFFDVFRSRPSTIRGRNMRVVILHTESPYQDDQQLKRAEHADLNLLNDPVNLDAYREIGPAYYMPHAYRPELHNTEPGLAEYATDFAFVGTGFPSRCEFFETMFNSGKLDGLDITLAGNWQAAQDGTAVRLRLSHDVSECTDNKTTALIYRSAKCGINFYRREGEDAHVGEGWALGPREIEMAACGLFFLRDPRPESDKLFPMLPTFAGPEDAAEQIAWWCAHDGKRSAIAAQARAAVADRTFLNNAKWFSRMLEEL
jgi:hypothetical protein